VSHEIFEKNEAAFVDECGSGDCGWERDDDNPGFRCLWVVDREGETNAEGGDDLTRVFSG
jgi:hypothetical protein